MPLTYSINTETSTLYWTSVGETTEEELEAACLEVIALFEKEGSPSKALFDHSQHLSPPSTALLNRVADRVRSGSVGSPRWAFVASGDVYFGLSRMLTASLELSGIECEVFRTREEAEAWLIAD